MGLTGKSFWKCSTWVVQMMNLVGSLYQYPSNSSSQNLTCLYFLSISEVWPYIKSYKAKRFLSFLLRSHNLSCNLWRMINLLFGVSSHFPFLSSVVSQSIFLYADKQLSRIGLKKALTCVLSNCSYTLSTYQQRIKGTEKASSIHTLFNR